VAADQRVNAPANPFQCDFFLLLPFQAVVTASAEHIDVGLGLFAQPYPRAFDRPDNPRGEVHRPAKDVPFFDL
jgi:hypothetical protein